MIDLVGQLAILGVANGVGYVVASLGLTIIFGVMRVVNFAHGEFYMLGAFTASTLIAGLGLHYLVALPLAAIIVGFIGLVCERLALAPLHDRSPLTSLLATLGLSIILLNGAELIWGASPRPVQSPFEQEVVVLGPVYLTGQRILIMLVGAVVVSLLGMFLRYATSGKLIRATAQDPEGAALVGINVGAVRGITFGIGCGLAGLSGGLLGATAMAYPFMGQAIALKAFAVIILGGLGSVPGAILGGLALGLVEAIAGGLLSTEYKDLFSYAVIISVLLLRPSGLVGARR
ncbi:branched-chain amino acid ABC transporter permease [Bradyrhizobium sp. KB893862 SZCCT0404]|uniref:branched-chain amino acid ABC transporter permease n=1 Tax=Bradyrhizobium sp. KB893862 SZCCT0404 TaxID=2807672 RepID=UPI001BA8A21D|nr:branched-chain amino acid ABC transporter permease [Bradyrhizobium sp. KB893862 SZCCT0404]